MKHVPLTLRIALFVLLGSLSACANNSVNFNATPEPQDGQSIVQQDGTKALVSRGKSANVTAAVLESGVAKNDLLEVELTFTSNIDHTLAIESSEFTALDNEQAAYQVLSLSDYEYVLNQISKNKWEDSSGNQGGGGSFIDSNAYTGSTSISSSGDRAYAGDAGRNPNNEARISRQLEGYLRAGALAPGQEIKGKICLVFPPGKTKFSGMTLNIPLGNEVHTLNFTAAAP